MAVPNVSAISLKPRLSSNILQLPTFHRSCNGNIFDVRELNGMSCSYIYSSGPICHYSPSEQCKSSFCNFSMVTKTVPVLPLSFLGHSPAETKGPIPQFKASRSNSWRPCKVKSEDSEGTLSSEAIILDEQALERELQAAIEEENYSQAAKIRDSLRFLHEDSKASVLAANARFYNSFRQGDLAAMQAIWAKGDNVCCVHPGVGGISGFDLIMGSWEFVWADYEFPLDIEVKNVEVHVRGDVGYVTCMEIVKTKGSSWGKQFATNVFEKIDGQWYICIHHASYIDL
ncbi:UVR domain [Macleaya cordata]|uniref:UVR domain n=1 Tax=Macleaya cordata TaxID=56857 RepID=A0A200R115_MACCD|nr:UVR domain [Macleaya cordata]